ncbi:hypothetical protein NS506_02654 [Nocardia seriolae]|uniref:XRE family transcriptional regulator n=1 Tax=Nocardia seriolae TaxID=37332 RepID=A0ABC8ARA2_9NOCA|nr:helix-turn-helix transcriptional regulator [Nocardia seriolae]APA96716.1 hypothetical protein NS506_02654 [Nocardia seriolae]
MPEDCGAPRVPRSFWDDPEVNAALGARHIGRILEAFRRHRYHSKPISQVTVAGWCGLSQAQLSRIIHGPVVTDLAKLTVWAEALRIPPDLLWFELPGGATRPDYEEENSVDRRRLLHGIAAVSGMALSGSVVDQLDGLRRGVERALMPDTISRASLDRWASVPNSYAQQYQSVAPVDLLSGVAADFTELQRHLNLPQSTQHRMALCRVSGQLAVLAGIFLAAQGNGRSARDWFRTAGIAAMESGDRQLAATALVRSAIVSLYHGAPSQALRSVTEGEPLLGQTPTPTLARALIVQARCMAKLGYTDEARSRLAAAETAFETMPSSALRDPALGFTERQFYFTCGNAYTYLGLIGEAEQMQREALAQYSPDERLDPALIELDRARCMLAVRDIPSACAHAVTTIAAVPSAHRGLVLRYGRAFYKDLPKKAHKLPEAADLRELVLSEQAQQGS